MRILGLVGVQRGVLGPLTQLVGGPGHDFGDLGVIGGHEGGQQLGRKIHPRPFVIGQGGEFQIFGVQGLAVLEQGHLQNAGDLFGEARQIFGVQHGPDILDLVGTPGGKQVNGLGIGQAEGGGGNDGDLSVLDGSIRGVPDHKGLEQGHLVLLDGVVHHRQGGQFQTDLPGGQALGFCRRKGQRLGGVGSLLPALFGGDAGGRRGAGCDLGRQPGQGLLLFFQRVLEIFLPGKVGGLDVGSGGKIPVPVYLHIPAAEMIGCLQQDFGLVHCDLGLADCAVLGLSECKKKPVYFGRQNAVPLQKAKQPGGTGASGHRNGFIGENACSNSLTQGPQFEDTVFRIGKEI